ncbi:MAG: hypothetical protein JWN95_2060 [Frankiales bacterium]|nr:hypothetical protein [Frankiales bacterium]
MPSKNATMTSGSPIELPVEANAATVWVGVLWMVASTATDVDALADTEALGSGGGLIAVLELIEALGLAEVDVLGGGGGLTAVLVAGGGVVGAVVVGVGVGVGLVEVRQGPLRATDPLMVRVSGLGPVQTTCTCTVAALAAAETPVWVNV